MNRIEEIAKAYAMGRTYAQGLKHRYAMAMDEEEWRTLKPKKAPDMFGDVEKGNVKSVLNKTTLVQDSTARMSDVKREVWNRYGYSLIKSIAEGNEQNFDFKPFYEKLRA